MKVEKDNNTYTLKVSEAYNPVTIKSNDGEILHIVQRDSGFELQYEDGKGKKQQVHLKKGKIIKFDSKLRGVARPQDEKAVTNERR